jgi:serine/threonine protein phosphatase PrpC
VDTHYISRLRAGDALMLCSDGVWHYFTNTEIGSVLSTLSAREASEFLIEKARSRARGGGDNLSIVVVKLEPLG